MRRTFFSAAALACTLCLILLAPRGVVPVFAQQSGSAPSQSQMSSENLSPQAQAKMIKKIQSAIIKLPYFGVYDNIAFELRGRTVILLGSVTSEHAQTKQDAERAVQKVEGVDKVVNNIQVLSPGPIDDRIRREVYRAIYSYGPLFKYSNDKNNPPIRIIVQSARVTLEGAVDSEADKNLCTLRVNQVPGVISVTNNLRVVKG